MSSAVKIHQK